jgi:SAM-dependent methyltransferase
MNEKPRILDVGCGARAQGDVNVDLYPKDRQQCRSSWNPKNLKNFVLADASYLPFKDDAFDLLTARHVIEHLHEPLQALTEWKRASPTVSITTPSEYSLDRTPTHLFTWNVSSLKNLLSQVFSEVHVSYTAQKNVLYGWLLKRLPLLGLLLNRFPSEIKATCCG